MKKPYISGWVILFGIILPILIASLLISFYFFNSFTLFIYIFILSPVIFVVLYASTHPSIQGWIIMAVSIFVTVYSFVTKTIWPYADIIFWLGPLLVVMTTPNNSSLLASFFASFLEGSVSTDGDDSFAEMQSYRNRDIEGERERHMESFRE